MKTISNQIDVVLNQQDIKNASEDTITFSEPLKIVGTGKKQWNGTIYDLATTNIDSWDGLITQDHGNKLSDVIGKAIGTFKNNAGIYIKGIRYAVKENPAAILAMNLLKGGFATGFSCETIGPDPDQNGVWKNHAVCGLSQVTHPNSSECYAVVSNSIQQAQANNLNTNELDRILEKLTQNELKEGQKDNKGIDSEPKDEVELEAEEQEAEAEEITEHAGLAKEEGLQEADEGELTTTEVEIDEDEEIDESEEEDSLENDEVEEESEQETEEISEEPVENDSEQDEQDEEDDEEDNSIVDSYKRCQELLEKIDQMLDKTTKVTNAEKKQSPIA